MLNPAHQCQRQFNNNFQSDSATVSKYGCHAVEHNGRAGTLFLITASEMVDEMMSDISRMREGHPLGDKNGAKSPQAIGHRLRMLDKGPNIFLLDRESTPHLAQYAANKANRKPHMSFVPNDVW